MLRWKKKGQPSRSELIDRKHRIAGEIRSARNEIQRRARQGEPVGELEHKLTQLESQHYETRLEIDRAEPRS